MVGGGSRSIFWNELLASLLNRELSICDQSEFGAALGVARLAMYQDTNIHNKNNIIKEIKITKIYQPKESKFEQLHKRYLIWKDLYENNKNISKKIIS